MHHITLSSPASMLLHPPSFHKKVVMQSTTAIERTHPSYAFQFESYVDNQKTPYVWSCSRYTGHYCRGDPLISSYFEVGTLHEIDLVLKLPTNVTDEDENYSFLLTVTSLQEEEGMDMRQKMITPKHCFISQLDWIEEESYGSSSKSREYIEFFGRRFLDGEVPKLGYIPPSNDVPNIWSSVGHHVGKCPDGELHEIDLVFGLPINCTDEDKHYRFVLIVTSQKDGEEEERIFIKVVHHEMEDPVSILHRVRGESEGGKEKPRPSWDVPSEPPRMARLRALNHCYCKSREEHYELCGERDDLVKA